MVGEWNFTSDFERYYNSCARESFRYTSASRNDAIHIVATLSGLIGGLVTVLNWVILPSVKLTISVVDWCHHRRVVMPLS